MRIDCDVVVVGGGPAGSHTAMAVARFSRQNLRVVLIDRNERPEFGKKTKRGWPCGDAVSRKSLEFVMENLGIRYEWPEIEHEVDGVLVISPDHETKVLFDGEGYLLNRKLWSQKQLQYLEKFGVEVVFGVDVRTLLSEDNRIVGAKGTSRSGEPVEVRAKVVVDASGSASVLRTNLPIESYVEREIDRDDMRRRAGTS
jgi:Dehydrogenases (flavoproteins)